MSNKDEPRVSEGYVAIPTTANVPPAIEIKDVEEVNIEDITDAPAENENNVEVDLETGEIKDPVEEEVQEAPVEKEVKDEVVKEDKRPSRAKKRIKQLHTEKTAAEQRALAAERKVKEMEDQLQDNTVYNKTAMKAALEANLNSLRKGTQDAIENGEAEESVRLNEEMISSKSKLDKLTDELAVIEAQPKPEEQVTTRKSPDLSDVPDKAIDWIDEHPQFKSDELFYVSAMTISQQLVNEGFDDNSEDFYEELDARLSPRFPEVFGIDQKNTVNYTEDTKETSDEEKDGNQNTSQNDTSSKRQVEQTVSGASRPPPSQKGKKIRGNESVVLPPETVRQAERWGLSLEQVARRVAHNQKNKRDDGYTPIIISKKS